MIVTAETTATTRPPTKPAPTSVPTSMPTITPPRVNPTPTSAPAVQKPEGPSPTPALSVAKDVEISVIWAPELDGVFKSEVEKWNKAYAEGRNPMTGNPLVPGEGKIRVVGKSGSSGTVMQGIINALQAPNSQNVEMPTIYIPSVSHWPRLANYKVGSELFTLSELQPTANAPVVLAIWESYLRALQKKYPDQPLGWSELLEVAKDPLGWKALGMSGDPGLGLALTDPLVSSTALSSLAEQYVAAAILGLGKNDSLLTLSDVEDPRVQETVRLIEEQVRHYFPRTTELRWYVAEGPSYGVFILPIEENDVPLINKTKKPEIERLIAIYPKEGTFVHEHPACIPNTSWVSPEQREAAKIFIKYLLTEPVQQRLMVEGYFRPVNPAVKLGYPFTTELGVDPSQPEIILDAPDPAVLAVLQANWGLIKKQTDVLLSIDTTGSMRGAKLDQAKKAAEAFVVSQGNNNRIGLMRFSTNPGIQVVVQLGRLESSKDDLIKAISQLDAKGDTPLYDALMDSIAMLSQTETSRIRAIVLLSDGVDTGSRKFTKGDVITALSKARIAKVPIILVAIAYGNDADLNVLREIARASGTQVYVSNPTDITDVLTVISKYF